MEYLLFPIKPYQITAAFKPYKVGTNFEGAFLGYEYLGCQPKS